MAELVLSSLVEAITGNVVSEISKECGLAWGVKTELEKLQLTVSSIDALLREAERRRVEAEDVKNWLKNLKDVLYDADDLMDDFSTEALRRRGRHRSVISGGKRILNEVCTFFSSSNQIVYAFKMAHRVKEIREKIDVIMDDRVRFQLEESTGSDLGNLLVNQARPETYHFETEPYVVGRDKDKEEVIEFLVNPDSEENLSILPIVGLGGLGKTTLAKLVFNDERVEAYFVSKLWVCVSTNFSVEDILRKIVRECTQSKEVGDLDMNELRKKLGEVLDGKRYLLILDDVWNENRREWLKLEAFLTRGARGSKILVTIRSLRVAATMATTHHELRGLPEDESVSLLMRMAMKKEQEWRSRNLEIIAREILKKCAGVPLAITTIGRLLLHTRNTEEDWLNFKDNDLSKISQEEGDIMPSLKLSYDFLPAHLKQCFAYSSLYEKDYELNPSELIHLWISQGFIKSSSNNKTPEQFGREYFMELVSRSFFQDIKEDVYGCIKRCKMHDLMHDLALMVAGDNCITISTSHVKEFPEGARHVSMVNAEAYDLQRVEKNQRIRSLLLFFCYGDTSKTTSQLDISHFRNLRALHTCYTAIETISDSIGKLKHLRSLDLSWNRELRALPDSISELCNLETLNLTGCNGLERLPRGITKLVKLRHLDVSECDGLTHMPKGIGKLTRLQTLGAFVVGDQKANPNAARLNELSGLTGLTKELNIQHLERLSSIPDEMGASFSMEKLALQSLGLHWKGTDEYRAIAEQVIERFQPRPDLKKLEIDGYGGARLPPWVSEMDKLVKINLRSCSSITCLPALDHLPFLKKIAFGNMRKLEWIELSGRGMSRGSLFQSLEELSLSSLFEFNGWSCRRVDANRFEGDDIQEEAKGVDDVLIPMFSDKVVVYITGCLGVSYLHGQQQLHLGGIVGKAVQQLLRNTTQSELAMPESSRMTFISLSSISLSALTSLTLTNVEHLPTELFQSLLSLKSLGIKDCPRLKALPIRMILRHLVTLEGLEIFNCRELDLSIEDGVDEECMQVQQLNGHSKLQELFLCMIEKMETLPWWIQHLNNLEDLIIFHCSNLKALPEWFPQLTSLTSFTVMGCGELSRRCKKNTGEDWPMISHIPDLGIW